jgi:hypothetical protein
MGFMKPKAYVPPAATQSQTPLTPPEPAPPPPNPVTIADASVQQAGAKLRTAASQASGIGAGSTIMTSPVGVMGEAKKAKKSLLGQ